MTNLVLSQTDCINQLITKAQLTTFTHYLIRVILGLGQLKTDDYITSGFHCKIKRNKRNPKKLKLILKA